MKQEIIIEIENGNITVTKFELDDRRYFMPVIKELIKSAKGLLPKKDKTVGKIV